MIKECVILSGQIINIGPWDYQYEEVDGVNVAKNPFLVGATIEQRDFEHSDDRGWFEVGTAATPTQAEQIATLKSKLAATEQAAADNSLTTQQLLESLIDKGVI